MQRSTAIIWLSSLVAALATLVAGVGLFSGGGSGPVSFTTLHGERVQIYGQGLYRNDTLFVGALNRGTDAATLIVAIPLLVLAMLWYRRGSLRGQFLLTGTLAYFLYVYASLALGAAYNDLFLLYIVLFSASFFAFIRSFVSIDLRALAGYLSPRTPRRGLAIFMLLCGTMTMVVWLAMGLLPALLHGASAGLLHGYTTFVTDSLDLGIITPACILTGILLFRRSALGYPMAASLLGILALLGPAFAAQTISQVVAGVAVTPGEIIGPIGGFGVISLAATGLMIVLLRSLTAAMPFAPVHPAVAHIERHTPQRGGSAPLDSSVPLIGSSR